MVDDKPIFRVQAWNWLASLNVIGALDSLKAVVHYVGDPPPAFADTIAAMGAEVTAITPFGSGHAAYCNKLQQLQPLLARNADYFILTDADLLFLQNPADYITQGRTRGKLVDKGNPPKDIMLRLLEAAGFFGEDVHEKPEFTPTLLTHRYNCNGGLYIVPGSHLEKIADTWIHWAAFCLDSEPILGKRRGHADQLGFMLASIECELPFEPLPSAANFPTHFAARHYSLITIPEIRTLHYHRRMNRDGFLMPTGFSQVDRFVYAANGLLEEGQRIWLADWLIADRQCLG